MRVGPTTRPSEILFSVLLPSRQCVEDITFGEEKFSLGNTAPYSLMISLILASRSGKANRLGCSSSLSSSSSAVFSSSPERVLSTGLVWSVCRELFGGFPH